MDITSDKSKFLKQVGTSIGVNKIKEVTNTVSKSTLDLSERSVYKFQNFFNSHYVFIIFVLLCGFTYFLYNYFLNNSAKKVIKNHVDLNNNGYDVSLENIGSKSSAYNMSLYLNNENNLYGAYVPIRSTIFQLNKITSFQHYTTNGTVNDASGICALYMDSKRDLIFSVKDVSYNIMSPFPKETWTNVHINIFNISDIKTCAFEFYINGKLTKTYVPNTTSTINQPTVESIIRIGGDKSTDTGYVIINNFTRWPYTLDHPKVWEIYKTLDDNTNYNVKINIKSESNDGLYKSINWFNNIQSASTDSELLLSKQKRFVTMNPSSLWLDANDPYNNDTKPTSGTYLKTWKDKSGNDRNGTAESSATRTGVKWVNSAADRGYFYFENTEACSRNFNGTIPITGSSLTVFTVSTFLSDSPNNGRIIGMTPDSRSSDWNNILSMDIESVPGTPRARLTRNSLPGDAGIFTNYGSFFITTAYFDGTKGYINSLIGASSKLVDSSFSSTGNFGINYYSVGSDPTIAAPMKGYISEIIVYNTALSLLDRQFVEGYLSWKWGLETNLPSSHPYSSATP